MFPRPRFRTLPCPVTGTFVRSSAARMPSCRRVLLRLLLLVPFVASPAIGGAASRPAPEPPADWRLESLMDRADVPGLAVAWLRECEVAEVRVLGEARASEGEAMTGSSAMEAASLSKPVFAWLVLRLVDEGVIDLDAPMVGAFETPRIAEYERLGRLTPRMLLSHQSGLPNWSGDPRDPERTDPLEFAHEPGERFSYSGEGFWLLQRYVEAVAGADLETLFRRELGEVMPSSTFAGPLPEDVEPAWGHGEEGAEREASAPAAANAAHSLRTVVADYGRFVGRLCSGDGLTRESVAAMREPLTLVEPLRVGGAPFPDEATELGWGLGLGRFEAPEGPVYFHWGDNGEFRSFFAFDPRAERGVVFFANAIGGLTLIDALVEPEVGGVDPILEWLDY